MIIMGGTAGDEFKFKSSYSEKAQILGEVQGNITIDLYNGNIVNMTCIDTTRVTIVAPNLIGESWSMTLYVGNASNLAFDNVIWEDNVEPSLTVGGTDVITLNNRGIGDGIIHARVSLLDLFVP